MIDLSNHLETNNLEFWIRSALTFGELPPSVEAKIQHLIQTDQLSAHDRTLLEILRDAIQDGCIRRISG
jgi:hypothetical protein